jgi:hypothetical protein
VVAAPFLAAAAFYLIQPEFSRFVRQRIQGVLSNAQQHVRQHAEPREPVESSPRSAVESSPRSAVESSPPSHLSPEYVGDYLDYAIDATAVGPTFALPVVGAIFALNRGMNVWAIIVLLCLGIPGLIFIAFKVYLSDPIAYVGTKYLKQRYTFLPAAGLALNLVACLLVAVFVKA